MNPKYNYLISVLYFCITFNSLAQDPVYSQLFLNPLYLNPAYSGNEECPRFVGNFRTYSKENFKNSSLSYDQYLSKLKGGVGVQYHSEILGKNTIRANRIVAIYTYFVDISEQFKLRPAVYAGFGNKNVEVQFYSPVTEEYKLQYSDFGISMLLKNRNIVSGVSIEHINRPNLGVHYWSHLPIKVNFHASYCANINENIIFTPSLVYQQHKAFNYLTTIALIQINNIEIGTGFRFRKNISDYIIGYFGFENNWLHLGYSYDYIISHLTKTKGGIHEISTIVKIIHSKQTENM